MLIGLATLAAAMLGGPLIYSLVSSGLTTSAALDQSVQYLCVMLPFYVVALGLLAIEGRAPIAANVAWPISTAGGAVIGLTGFGMAVGLTDLFGAIQAGAAAEPLEHRMIGLAFGALLIAFQAFGEELFFRGWLQPILITRLGPWIGVLLTALFFAAAHAIGGIGVLAFVNDALAGLVFGLLAMRTGGLLAPFAAHFAWNWTEQSLVGLTPNPGVHPLGSLFDWDLVGPSLLSGGTDELNGAIGTTVALLAMLTVTLAWRPAKH